MTVLNFGHPLTPEHRAAIERYTHAPIGRVIERPVSFDHERSFEDQAASLVDSTGLTTAEWQSDLLLVNLPSLSIIGALVLTEIHGRSGYFPAVLRMRPASGSTPPRFEVAEILNLQDLRARARRRRTAGPSSEEAG